MFLGYVAVAISISAENFYEMFGFVLDVTQLVSENTIWNRAFSNTLSLLINNCFVLISLVFLAFMYRGFAVLLTISWNACTWGLALTLMVQQGITSSQHLSSGVTILVSVVALTPHLALEALVEIVFMAYIFRLSLSTRYGKARQRVSHCSGLLINCRRMRGVLGGVYS